MKYFDIFYIIEGSKEISAVLSTIWCYIKLALWHIPHGKCKFYGNTLFQRVPNSEIIIGDQCEFRSRYNSNQIGVYSPCMLSTVKPGSRIYIGDNCGFSGCVIGCAKSVTIGNNVRCGANTLITDTDWHSEDNRTPNDRSVVIKDNVWLGYGVKVLKGVTIGENSIVGLGSIVTKDIPANCVAAGNPCKVIRYLEL